VLDQVYKEGNGNTLRRSDDGITKQTGATVDTARPQRKTVTKEYLEKRSRERKCVQQDTSTAGGRWGRQHKTELDGDKWSVAYFPPAASRHKSKSSQYM